MRILISDEFGNDKIPSLRKSLMRIFPGSEFVSRTSNFSICVVPYESFDLDVYKGVPKVSNLWVQNALQCNLNPEVLKNNHVELINTNLFNMRFYIMGFSTDRKAEISSKITRMCGVVNEHFLKDGTDVIIAKTLNCKNARYAKKKGIPLVNMNFVLENYKSKEKIEISPKFCLKPLEGLKFTLLKNIENYSKINQFILDNGGIVNNDLRIDTSFLVIDESWNVNDNKIINVAVDMKIKITNADDIFNAVNNSRLLEGIITPCVCSNLFHDITFEIDSEIESSSLSKISMIIKQNGGIVSENPTYFISMCSCKPNARTPIWLERSVEEGEILDQELFCFFRPPKSKFCDGNKFIFCVSGYNSNELKNLISTIKWINSQYTFKLGKKCTHLITKDENSRKATFARKWGIKICNFQWMIELINENSNQEPKNVSNQNNFLSDDDDYGFDCIELDKETFNQEIKKNDEKKFSNSLSETKNINDEKGTQEINFLSSSDDLLPEDNKSEQNDCQHFLSDDDVFDIIEGPKPEINENPKILQITLDDDSPSPSHNESCFSSPETIKNQNGTIEQKSPNPLLQDNVQSKIETSMKKILEFSNLSHTHSKPYFQEFCDLKSMETLTQLPSNTKESNFEDLYDISYDNTDQSHPKTINNLENDPLLSLINENNPC